MTTLECGDQSDWFLRVSSSKINLAATNARLPFALSDKMWNKDCFLKVFVSYFSKLVMYIFPPKTHVISFCFKHYICVAINVFKRADTIIISIAHSPKRAYME